MGPGIAYDGFAVVGGALIVTSLLLTATAPFAIFAAAVGDVTKAAIVAGIFSVVNTVLNVLMLRRVGVVGDTVNATKQASREGNKALLELAEQHQRDEPKPKP